jgi:hypothetical protein
MSTFLMLFIVLFSLSTTCFYTNVNAQNLPPSYVYEVVPNAETFSAWQSGTYTSLSLSDDGVASANLNFTFVFYNRSFTSVSIQSNGNLQFATSSGTFNPPSFPTDNSLYLPVLAAFWTDLYSDTPTSTFMYRTEGNAPNRRFVMRYYRVNFCCSAGQGPITYDIVLFEGSNRIETRYYEVGATPQGVVIGLERGGGQRSDGSYDYTVYWNDVVMTTTDAAALQGNTIRWMPVTNITLPDPIPLSYNVSRVTGVPTFTANLTNEVFLPPTDDGVNSVPLGFSFNFYGTAYTGVNVSANGDIQFDTSSANSVTLAMPSSTTTRAPFIAVLNTNLWPQCSYCRSYGTYGLSPNRVFTLRYNNVPYFYYATYADPFLSTYTVSFDVLLFESNSTIEVRYYRVPSVAQYVVAGIQGLPILRADFTYDYTAVVNNVYLTTAYLQLNGNTIRYVPAFAIPPPRPVYDVVTYSLETINSVTARADMVNTSLACSDDGFMSSIPIGFDFHFFERTYSSVGMACNGNLQFLTTSTSLSPLTLPSGNSGFLPILAFFWSDLNIAYGGSMVYGNMGNSPNREFHLRFTNIRFFSQSGTDGVTCDVVLYESDSHFELRYHTVTASTTSRNVLIGIEGSTRMANGSYNFLAVHNNLPMNDTAASNIQGKTYRFTVNPLPYTPPTPVPMSYTVTRSTGAVSMELVNSTSLPTQDETVAEVDLGFFFYFYGRWYNKAYISSNGEMHFRNLPASRTPTDFPQQMNGYHPMIAYYFVDLYPVRGEERVYSTLGTSPNRMFVLRHRNTQYYYCGGVLSFDVILYEANGRIEFRYFNDMTDCQYVSVLIGIQGNAIRRSDYTYDYAAIANLLPATLPFVNNLKNSTYTFTPLATVTPPTPFTPFESPVSTYSMNLKYSIDNPITLNNPVPLPGGDDTVVEIALGFNFVFYNEVYQKVYLGGNGNAQFKTRSTTFSAGTMPTGPTGMQPYIAFFMCDLYPTAAGVKMYQTTGQPGNRKFVLRYLRIPYLSNTALTNDIDLILFEADNHIEVHYHRISPATNTITIGMQGTPTTVALDQQDYVVLNNAARLDTTGRGLLLNGATLSFTPKMSTPSVQSPRYNYVMSQNTATLPTRITLTSAVSLLDNDDAANSYVSMGFSFPFFGMLFTYCSISTNGNIQFVTNSVTGTGSPLPMGDTQHVPAIFFAWTDLYPSSGAVRQYAANQGSTPNRYFVVRYTDVAYRTSLALSGSSSAPKLSVDVILNENGNIEFRYYRLDAVYAPVTIGIESALHPDHTSEYYVFHNALPLNSSRASAIANTAITFQYLNTSTPYVAHQDAPAVIPPSYSQGTYQVTYLRGVRPEVNAAMSPLTFRTAAAVPMGINFTIFGTVYSQVWVDRRGLLAFGGNPANITTYSLPNSVSGVAAYIPFALSSFVTNIGGVSCTTLGSTVGSRSFVLRFSNQRYADLSGYLSVDVVLHEVDSKIELRYYRVDQGPLAMTVGVIGPTSADVPNFATFLNNAIITRALAKGLHRATIIFSTSAFVVPAPTNSYFVATLDTSTTLPTTAPTLDNARNLQASNDGIDRIPLGFVFRFYGQEYQSINLDANGDIQFATGVSDIVPDALPLGNMALAPFLAFFYTDLYPNYADSRQIQYSGDGYPNRVFTLRLNNVPYYTTRFNSANPPSVTIDVKLFEVDGHIEILYYRVDACEGQTVVVGAEGLPYLNDDWSSDYTIYNGINAVPATSSVVSPLVGRKLSFTPRTPIGLPRYIAPPFYTLVRSTTAPVREDMTGATDLGTGSYVLYPNISIGFNFPFYNVSYNQVTISSNGNLQFTTQLYNYYPYAMPTGQNMGAFISFLMGYLYQTASGNRLYKTFGTSAPNRYFVVRFNQHTYCCTTGAGPISIDTVLFENGRIEIRIFSVGVSSSYPALIGVQNSSIPRADGTYDYTVVPSVNAVFLTQNNVNYLNNRTFSFEISSRMNWTGPAPLELSYNAERFTDAGVVSALANPTYLQGSDEAVDRIPIGFGFRFFSKYYKTVNVGSNGELQFETTYPSRTGQPMPLTSAGRLPLLAFFYTDLYPTASTSKSYVTTGTYPNRILTIRFSDVPYQSCRNSLVTIDVKLFEVDSHFEVIYYRVDSCSSQEVLIGVQESTVTREDFSYDFLTVVNQAHLQSQLASSINGTRYVFRLTSPPTGSPPTIRVSTSATSTYNISYIPTVVPRHSLPNARAFPTSYEPVDVNIGFNFVFYGIPYSVISMTPNGVLQFRSTQYVYDPAPMPTGVSTIFPYIAFAYSYQFYYASYNDRSYATTGIAPNRTFTIRFDNVYYAYNAPAYGTMDLVLFELDNHIEMRYYSVSHTFAQTFLNGIQASTTDYAVAVNAQVLTPELAMMLSDSTIVIQGVNPIPRVEMRRVQYGVTRTASVPSRETISSPTTVFFSRTDDAATNPINIGFTFPFYGIGYNSLVLSSNGNIQFGTRYTGFASTPLPLQMRTMTPMISYAFTNLVIPANAMTYGTGGSSPNRYFIVRLVDVPYFSQSPAGNVSVDCLLYESGTVEMRYYRMNSTWQSVIIGLESSKYPDGNSEFTAFWNGAPLTATQASTLSGATLTFSVTSNEVYSDRPVSPIVPTGYAFGTYNVTIRDGTAPYQENLPGNPSPLPCCTYYVNIPLNFGFIFMSRNYTSVYLDAYGRLGFRAGSYTYLSTSMPFGNSAYTPLIAFGWGLLYPWYRTDHITYATVGQPGSRYFVLRFKNVPYSVSPYLLGISVDVYLYEADGRIEMHYYKLDPSTDTILIGIQGRTLDDGTVDFAYLWNDGPISSAVAAGIQGKTVVYQAINGAVVNDTGYAPPTYTVRQVRGATRVDMTGATYLSTCDDCVATNIPIGFTFQFFGVNYTALNVSSNGNVQFQTSSTTITAMALPDGNPALEPVLFMLSCDLNPNHAQARMYKTFGNAPNRYFVVTFNDTIYYGSTIGVTFDTIFYETTNAIEIRYHRLDYSSRYITIGVDDSRALRNGEPDYAAFINYQLMTTTLASNLVNSSVFFERAPVPVYSSSSTGAAFGSSSPSSPVISSSSSVVVPPASSSAVNPTVSSSSSTPVIPSFSSSSSSASTSVLPIGCVSPSALPVVGHTFDLVISRQFSSLQASNFMAVLVSAIVESLANAGYPQAANQIRCGLLRSAATNPAITTNVYTGTDAESVATIYVQRYEGGARPEAMRDSLASILSNPNNPINTRLATSGQPTISNLQIYKTCTNGLMIGAEQLCEGEAGNAGGGSSSLGGGAIAGIIIGVLVGVAILLVAIFFFLRNRGDKAGATQFHDEDVGENSTNNMNHHGDSEHSVAHTEDDGVELATHRSADHSEDFGDEAENETQESEELV